MATAETLHQQPIVEQAERPNRLQRRFDRFTKTIKEQQEEIARQRTENERLIERLSDRKAEIAELEKALARALDSRDLYRDRLKQRMQRPPITPDLMKGKA